ncbi:hypothetical protein MN116_008039 [Schistosoma mekongi]|uniref:Ubiquitin carboxyl-terminal hydrolase n=1 Tax=Schistosoma mekongi TaxID=38744 RepID=A0AAE1Z8Q3_SCHME|nr:hypothetical protein MN116_008039 [Schistosoma mekongi]
MDYYLINKIKHSNNILLIELALGIESRNRVLSDYPLRCNACRTHAIHPESHGRLFQLLTEFSLTSLNLPVYIRALGSMGKKIRNRKGLSQTSVNEGKNLELRNNVKENLPVKGLHNLGNTCYFNAALQCLGRSPWLLELLAGDEPRESTLTKPNEVNNRGLATSFQGSVSTLCISLPPTKCILTTQFKELISILKSNESSIKMFSFNTISPGMLRNVFIERCPRFSGFRQHDSHELIRCLLDCIKQEELIRWKKGILLKLNINTKDVRDDVKESVRNWGKAASTATIVDRLFGGVLVSTIECCCCGTVRPRFEPFLDLSLSVTETDVSKHNRYESVSRHHSKDASHCKQLRKKERKRKTQKQRKYHSFTHDSQSDQEHLNHNSSDSDTERNGDGDQSKDTFIAKCCADVDDKRIENENVSLDVIKNHIECDNNSNDDNIGANLTNQDESNHLSEALNHSNSEETMASSDGNCADSEVSDSVTSPQLTLNGSDVDLKRTETGDLHTAEVITSELENFHLNSVAPSSQLLCDSDELSQAIHYARVPFNRSVNINTEQEATSIYQYLSKYTSAELLTGSNRLVCDVCTKRQTLSGKSLSNSSIMESTDDNMESNNNNNDNSNSPILQDVIKRDLIYRPPPILTIHLKRFQQVGVQLRKSQKRIQFPMYLDITPFCSVLAVTLSSQIRYRLYGVIEHTGHLASGHYVSYIAVSKSNNEHINDPSTILENQFIGPLNRSPKWPLSVDDLIQRLRRCNHQQLLLALNHFTPIHNDEIINDSRQWFYCSDSHVTRVSPETVLNCQPYILFYERIE